MSDGPPYSMLDLARMVRTYGIVGNAGEALNEPSSLFHRGSHCSSINGNVVFSEVAEGMNVVKTTEVVGTGAPKQKAMISPRAVL